MNADGTGKTAVYTPSAGFRNFTDPATHPAPPTPTSPSH